jgi:nicotinamidase/pyrazinamidase
MRLDAATDALLIIDMQNDFLPGGSLAVANADQIIPDLNALADRFVHVIVTQDWHPAHHISFASTHHKRPYTDTIEAPYGTQHLWPDHCLQGTHGAALHEALDLPHAELILRKGFRKNIDSYSAFLENDRTTPTGLAGYLRERNIERLFFTGVAYDFCVGFSALAAAQLGFEAIVLEDLTRPVGLAGTVESTNQAFAEAGVRRLSSTVVSQ